MTLSHEHVGPKIAANIKVYISSLDQNYFAMRYPVLEICLWNRIHLKVLNDSRSKQNTKLTKGVNQTYLESM